MQANELLQRIESNRAPLIIDARSEIDFKLGHIKGAINAPVRKAAAAHGVAAQGQEP